MKAETYNPIILCPTDIRKNHTVFLLPDREVEVTIPQKLSRSLIKFCDGTISISNIKSRLCEQWDENSVNSLLTKLVDNGVLIESRNIGEYVWKFVTNPTAWYRDLSEDSIKKIVLNQDLHASRGTDKNTFTTTIEKSELVNKLLERKSTSHFSGNKVSKMQLSALLWAAYGKLESYKEKYVEKKLYRRTVPSAGALYPLMIHIINFQNTEYLTEGIYRVHYPQPLSVDFAHISDIPKNISCCFVNPKKLIGVSGVIFISGNFSRSAHKYNNRALLYILLEAGHVAQNVHLAAQESGLETIEVGGFYEDKIANLLALPSNSMPLTSILYGEQSNSTNTSERIPALYVNEIISCIEEADYYAADYHLDFKMFFAKPYKDANKHNWSSCGRSYDADIAEEKAKAECVEWYSFSRSSEHPLVSASYNELQENAVDPKLIAAYLPNQYKLTPIQKFNNNEDYQWCPVQEMFSGKRNLMLADFIYYPYSPKGKHRYFYANSSGSSAHTSLENALEHAILELIEREAFIVTWVNRIKRKQIKKNSLTEKLIKRINYLEHLDFDVRIVNITYDLTPVVMVIAKNDEVPYFSCAAASSYYPADAVEKAMMELEASIYCRFRDGPSKEKVKPNNVFHPLDHGRLYEISMYINKTRFMFEDVGAPISLKELEDANKFNKFSDLCGEIQHNGWSVYFAHMNMLESDIDHLPYQVVKVIIPGVVPMTFGFGLETFVIERMRSLPESCGIAKRKPISKLNRFPHPFT